MHLTENTIKRIITEELKKSEVVDIVKKDPNAKKWVKEIVRDVVKDMYRVLWQHNSIFQSLGN